MTTQSLSSEALFHGRYRVVRALKQGGMGAVYEVVDTVTNGPRALKVMLPSALTDPDMRARFALEVKITGAIESEHLARVLDAGVDETSDSPFLVMELLRGEDLGWLVANRGALPPEEVVMYLQQTALALEKTHAEGIIHRDIKPENLFVTQRDDGSPCIKVLDFGIAKMTKGGDAQRTRALGTPLYMAPEQARGDKTIGAATDIYALAHVAYTLLVGEAYWRPEQEENDSLFQFLTQVISGIKERPTARALRRLHVTLPPEFDVWLMKATDPDPTRRYTSATAAVEALAEVFGVPLHHIVAPSVLRTPSGAVPMVPAATPLPAPTPLPAATPLPAPTPLPVVTPLPVATPLPALGPIKDPGASSGSMATPLGAALDAPKKQSGKGALFALLGILVVLVLAVLAVRYVTTRPRPTAAVIVAAPAPEPSPPAEALVAPAASAVVSAAPPETAAPSASVAPTPVASASAPSAPAASASAPNVSAAVSASIAPRPTAPPVRRSQPKKKPAGSIF